MSLEVRWAKEAEFTFDNIVSLIKNNWGEQSSDKFIRKTQKILNSISNNPHMFPASEIENTRKAVISKQSSVFYEVYPDKIMLVFFWDNRQDSLFG